MVSLQAQKWEQVREMAEKAFIAAAKLADVPPGTKKLVELSGTEILLCNTRDKLFAVRNMCSHAYERIDCGRMKNGWISCPVHGARFDLETGAAMNPPATTPIDIYEVRVVGDVIEVAV
jgi:3-phenylpropionate/trans-cinnamate dioxygenase ferredoxin subunit